MVYDLGGGSFDCTAVEVRNNELIVLAEEGLSALGGMDIDDRLRDRLEYIGDTQYLRVAKEELSSASAPNNSVHGLTNSFVADVLDEVDPIVRTAQGLS